ncbi:MAG: UDP-N-acetylglucosamine 2-epimerase [Ruthenibacterium sp.]
MKKQHSIAVITGTRAEYGLLRPVLQKMQTSSILAPQLIVTGAHLSAAYGNTVAEIEQDEIPIAARIDILKFDNVAKKSLAIAKTVAYTIDAFSDYFTRHRPDAVLVLGDRYEIFAVGTAAALLEIPLIHISGGDVTYGAADDYFRHCLTKMAALHFPSCAIYANRLLAMGEQPNAVHQVGGLGDENLRNLPLLSAKALSESIDFDVTQPYALVTFHPETAGGANPTQQCHALLAALQKSGIACIFTKANADAGGAAINEMLDTICKNNANYRVFQSMGVLRYLSAMRYAAVVAGNSSSGVVETPTLGVPAVNIGARQRGRIICDNVICCDATESSILSALQTALTPAFQSRAKQAVSPYNGGDTSGKIVAAIEAFVTSDALGKPKEFYDLPIREKECGAI